MLLWLTLALLWSPTCWAQQIFGPGGPISVPPETFKMMSPGFESLRVILAVLEGETRLLGLNPQEIHLQKGEHFTGVLGSFRHFLSYLVVHTNLWPFIRFGCPHGQFFIASPDDSQKELTGVYGQYTVQGIISIGFDWDYPSS